MKGERKISPKRKLTDTSVYKENEVRAIEKYSPHFLFSLELFI